MGSFDLSGYKPEAPSDGGFEAFKYNGPCKVNKAIVSVNDKVDTEFYPDGCNQIEIEVVVLQGANEGRKLWKRFNLDDQKEDKKGKISSKKLADQLFAAGLTFSLNLNKETGIWKVNLEELKTACSKLVEMTITIKAWSAKFGDREQQMWNIKSIAPAKWEESPVTPTKQPAF